jgi:hypothetical protein
MKSARANIEQISVKKWVCGIAKRCIITMVGVERWAGAWIFESERKGQQMSTAVTRCDLITQRKQS